MVALTRTLLAAAVLMFVTAAVSTVAVTATRAQPRPAPTVEQAFAVAQMAQVAQAVYQMDKAGLHDLDDATAAGSIPRGALGNVRTTRIVVAATRWPEPLQATAAQFVAAAQRLEAALAAENAAQAAPDAKLVHDVGHDLSRMAYAWMSGAPVPTGGHGAAGHTHAAPGTTATAAAHTHGEMFRQPSGSDAPTLSVELLPDAKSGFNVKLTTTNWTWAPERVNTAPLANEGHAHLYVNGVKVARVYGPWFHIENLRPGPNEVRVTLNANDHAEYATADGTMVAMSVTVVQPAVTAGTLPASGHTHP